MLKFSQGIVVGKENQQEEHNYIYLENVFKLENIGENIVKLGLVVNNKI